DKERLHALPATRNALLIFAKVTRQRQVPLTEIAQALRRSGPFFGPGDSGKEQTRQQPRDRDDDQQFNQRESGACACRHYPSLLVTHRPTASARMPSAPKVVLPGSGTATMVSNGRFAAVGKLRELKTPLTLASAADNRRLRLSPANTSPVRPGA